MTDEFIHASDCAVNNPPAFPAGPCDCDAGKLAKMSEGDMGDDVPQVGFEIEWHSPMESKSTVKRYNSDAARTRLADVARAAVLHALENGEAKVTITVTRIAAAPPRT